MPLADYCHPVDVLREYNPQLTETNLQNAEWIGNADLAQVRARIEATSASFDSKSGTPLRLVRRGSPGTPETYETHDAPTRGVTAPIVVDLDNRGILPFDSDEGDVVELRTGRDNWEDVTAEAGNEFALESRPGRLTLYRWLVNRIHWESPTQRYLRVSYRYGGLGGGRDAGGQTTLDSSATNSTTTLSVTNAGRLVEGGVVLVNNSEYVRITDVDYTTDELTVKRGVWATTADSHDSGDVVHYCPESVRQAVAQKVAAGAIRHEEWVANLVDGDGGVDPSRKLDDWEAAFDAACARHSAVRTI